MKVYDLKGKEHYLDVRSTTFKLKTASKSKLQQQCAEIIKKHFPHDIILEEVTIPGMSLYIDFLLPSKKIAFEIHGRQHDQYVKHFHKNTRGFLNAQQRDENKSAWCKLNKIMLVTVRSPEELADILG